ncbi:unnamed protein product [Trichogramma brassicae]|uniref:C2H2-type domain-containing protein n=1 Tax=Trichogramma brassicae TaxID=86971 RepID=A0A6H5IWF4_9HYME|nr:unnamed protein product [Trichogramma brassicae]
MSASEEHRFENNNCKVRHKCDYCGKILLTKRKLDNHVNAAHLKLRKHKCEECRKVFRYKSDLNRHIAMVHEKIKEHNCEECGKVFGQKFDLTRHIDTVHLELKEHMCEECGKSFKVEEDNYGAKDNLKDNKVNLRKEETSLFCDIQTLLTDIGKRKRPSAESADSTSNSNISENQLNMSSFSDRSDGDSQSRSSSIDKDEFIRYEPSCYVILDEWRLSDEDDLRIRTSSCIQELPKESSSSKKDESIKKSSNKQDQSTSKSISKQDELTKKSSRETDKRDTKDFESSKHRSTTCIDRYENELVRQRILDEFRKLRKSIDWKIKEKRIRLLEHFDYLYENYGASGQVPYPRAVFSPEEMESLLFDAISMIAESAPRDADADTYVLFIRFAANSGYRIGPARDENGRPIRRRATPVHRAANCDTYYRYAVRDLFEIYGWLEVNYVDEHGLTHLHVACRHGFEDIVWGLLELGRADPSECTGIIDAPLTWTLARGYESMAELLLRYGADPNGVPQPGGTRPLHVLCAKPCDAGFDYLERHFQMPKRRGILLNPRDWSGDTPLRLALASDSRKTVRWLLKRGADPNLANEAGESPLHLICKREEEDETLLFMFIKSCSVNDLDLRIDVRDDEGDTPLHSALRRGHARLAELLLRNGADPSSANDQGQTPLHAICETHRNDGSLLRVFLDVCDELGRRPKLDAADSRGRSPLQYAVARLQPRAVEVLLERGADVASFRFPGRDIFGHGGAAREDNREEYVDLRARHAHASRALVVAELLVNAGYRLDRRDAVTMMHLYARLGLFKSRALVLDRRDSEDLIAKSLQIEMRDGEPKCSLHDFFAPSLKAREIGGKITYVQCYEFMNSQKLSAMNSRQEAACLVRVCEAMWIVLFHRFAVDCFWELKSDKYPIDSCEKVVGRLSVEDMYHVCLIAANDDKVTPKLAATTMLRCEEIARRLSKIKPISFIAGAVLPTPWTRTA